ncbi:5-formyltetrahydrofolate cyclo-ligase [Methylobrevis pamukkalensis]|uniref:5-formyltetrahydrofolate cyclo-ligase n=1 Tax=Methylobrevis pamukkalensis TaxID=1439726 RepID=A0A1E3H2M6_9HYPH|nr:5-formyltetrahydrofolate cyclo-ligase [Methylobrevis pamukkalensis]ODN70056.1 5-formyltetrahydrofolate cyclo-ligase family protein [Methylobrevis pamukkalensis]
MADGTDGAAALAAAKQRVRAERLALRDALPAETRAAAAAALVAHADGLGVVPGSVVSAFLPIRSEIDLRPLMAHLRAVHGVTLGLPIIMPTGGLFFRAHDEADDLVPLGFGTYGPGPDKPVVVPELILAPLSAFDRAGGRIGYGKGHYDQTIARLRREGFSPRVFGVAFACQEVDRVPAESHDVPLHGILTEQGLIRTGEGAQGEGA